MFAEYACPEPAERDGEGMLRRRFIYGPGLDEPICLHTRDQVGDLTGDARVDLDDLLALAGQWLLTDADPEFDPLYDLTQDGKIDNADADALSAHWRKLTGAGPVQVFYYHFDGLGSVVALSDAAGDVVATYAYDVYGRSQPAGATHGNPYRFTARRWDAETGLYYYRARYYNPAIGRFLQPDPIGYADGLNWYLYCANNPIIMVDPLGLCGSRASYVDFSYSGATGLDMAWYVTSRAGAQTLANYGQGLQDMAIGTVNLATTLVAGTVIPKIPSPQWAKNRFVGGQSDLSYGVEKFSSSALLTWGAGAVTKAVTAGSKVASGGRLGNVKTRTHVAEVATTLEKRGWKITGGGGKLPEEYLSGPTGRLGSNYLDITATKNGHVLRVNTVDTLADGVTPTAREAAAAAAIRAKKPTDHLLLTPKPKRNRSQQFWAA